MRMNKILLTITALLCYTVLFAQSYSGIVLEKDGKTPIVGVSVSLVTSNGMLTAWGYTDNEGAYSVSLPKDKTAEKIYYSLLGYKKIAIPLADFPFANETEYTPSLSVYPQAVNIPLEVTRLTLTPTIGVLPSFSSTIPE